MASLIPNFNIEPTFFSDLSQKNFDPWSMGFFDGFGSAHTFFVFYLEQKQQIDYLYCDKRKKLQIFKNKLTSVFLK